MTDAELAFLEAASIATNDGTQLQLIQELRRTQKERDWIIKQIAHVWSCPTSTVDNIDCRRQTSCTDCWLHAAKEATSCQKN